MASVSISGDFGKLHQWGRRLKSVARVKRDILANVGEELLELVREGFEKESDPYGAKWKATLRGGRILQDTGRLRNSFHRKQLSSSSVTIGAGASYAQYHQSGTRRMVARKMLPDRGLPAGWKRRVNAIAQLALKQALGG